MFYLQLYGGERERNVLFNDALNTFYLWLYGVRHMVKDHSDSEKGNPQPPHRLLLSINSKSSFICTIPQTYSYMASDRSFSVDPAAVWAIFRSNQWSTTGLSKAVVCTVLSMEKCI